MTNGTAKGQSTMAKKIHSLKSMCTKYQRTIKAKKLRTCERESQRALAVG